jgi:Glycosyl transferase family 2
MSERIEDRTSAVARQPLLSVIVPAWNSETTIQAALASILDDDAVPLECVVVDDGSTDGTAAAVEAIAARDPRVVFIRSPGNEGVSEARNRALRVARGDWLAFVDADDRLRPGGLGAMWRASQASDARAIIGQRIWNDGLRTWITDNYDRPDIRLPGRKSIADNPGLLYYASATGKLIHRSCTDDLWFHGRTIGDQPWTIRALLRAADRIDVIGDVVYEWNRPAPGVQGGSITSMTRSRADLSVDAVGVATEAVLAVVDEADRTVADAPARARIVVAYVERLIAVDLANHLKQALARRDPRLADVLAAIEAFVRSVPEGAIAGSPALARFILVPTVERLRQLSPPNRRAYWSLLRAARRVDPRIVSKVPPGPARRTLRLVELLPGPVGPTLWEVWHRGSRITRAVRRRLMRAMGRTKPTS